MLEIELDKKSKELVKDTDLSELCITSSVVIKKDNYDKIKVDTTKAVGEKCPICWKISKKSNDDVFVFNGWMFSSSPSITPFDHPVYDIWLVKCY